ncbi:hypothetical protein MMC18_006024 [Xylographa bjoerkii]|nr:hypothetical protein [Xylographa bjoerkii]
MAEHAAPKNSLWGRGESFKRRAGRFPYPHRILLLAVTAASFAGTSNLFAAYLAGASISWWDTEVSHSSSKDSRKDRSSHPIIEPRSAQSCIADRQMRRDSPIIGRPPNINVQSSSKEEQDAIPQTTSSPQSSQSGALIYQRYYAQTVQRILKPLFFASIGFSIPITRMVSARIVWRGIVYAVLMAFAKLACGLWLIRFSKPLRFPAKLKPNPPWPLLSHLYPERVCPKPSAPATNSPALTAVHPVVNTASPPLSQPPPVSAPSPTPLSPHPNSPLSIYPAAILGSAMVARGEIGFLISSLAASRCVFADPASTPSDTSIGNDIFLIITWAIVLCTIIGPLSVGLLVRRVKRLGKKKGGGRVGRRERAGEWGIG